jgi:parallel beta-helix repeat protein
MLAKAVALATSRWSQLRLGRGLAMKNLIRPIATAAIASLMLMFVGMNAALAASCSVTISSCGCTIDSSGIFKTSGALMSSSSSVDCIDITVSNVVLILQGDITGPSSGVTADGIHVMSGATNSFIEGSTTSTPNTISGFANGVEADASGATIEDLKANGNSASGIVLSSASNSMIGDSTANLNGATGIMVDGGINDILSNDETDSNVNGFEITTGSGNAFNDGGANSNTGYGMWIRASNGNVIKDSSGMNNGTAVYIGCAANKGPTGKPCSPSAPGADKNRIQESNMGPDTSDGIAIDTGNTLNRVIATGAFGDGGLDYADKNPGCDHNVWLVFLNNTTKKKPGCIHALP